jgi:hypothetical protein
MTFVSELGDTGLISRPAHLWRIRPNQIRSGA